MLACYCVVCIVSESSDRSCVLFFSFFYPPSLREMWYSFSFVNDGEAADNNRLWTLLSSPFFFSKHAWHTFSASKWIKKYLRPTLEQIVGFTSLHYCNMVHRIEEYLQHSARAKGLIWGSQKLDSTFLVQYARENIILYVFYSTSVSEFSNKAHPLADLDDVCAVRAEYKDALIMHMFIYNTAFFLRWTDKKNLPSRLYTLSLCTYNAEFLDFTHSESPLPFPNPDCNYCKCSSYRPVPLPLWCIDQSTPSTSLGD